ncbi:hypothetical protein LC087_19230 (plasmid) [Bacillus carboniphilus]|uniref:Holin n=1 Tax=Bacillus carboniphilus TaxID=86663 RepID=A0ABY9JYM7_9BACI|nr:hypothetical protein [Bacillus carboniphilus]WLR44501.1 hypothetical protein LC087_19230 [Bacillus carboniphilus]
MKTTKFVLSVFSVYAVLQITQDMNVANSWILTESVQMMLSFLVALIVLALLNKIENLNKNRK